jgi:hypothetical protein
VTDASPVSPLPRKGLSKSPVQTGKQLKSLGPRFRGERRGKARAATIGEGADLITTPSRDDEMVMAEK